MKNRQGQDAPAAHLSLFALVAPKATPGYAGGKKIAYSEE